MAATAPADQQSRAATPSPAARLSVDSEVGTLRRVILQQPELELKLLTPSNITIAGSELGRGRGGPRCMSCPIEREAA